MDNLREKLIKILVEKTGWGPVAGWQGGDFRKLNQLIFEQTRVNISESTLRRFFGKSDYPHLPSETTLNTLAIFAGFKSWRDFRAQSKVKQRQLPKWKSVTIAGAGMLPLVFIALIFYRSGSSEAISNNNYVFTCRPVTRTIPNSVIFHYDVHGQTAPVYIQQSWDDHTRIKVAADGNTYASVYYRPGFFLAKLIVGDRVVKEHPLVIPTKGWLGLIYGEPTPTYLKGPEFMKKDMMEVRPDILAAHGAKANPRPARAELYNVGNFTPAQGTNFDFSAQVKSDDTSNACGKISIFLITNGIPISMALCSKGCVATTALFNGRELILGKTADLSGLGVELGLWNKTEIKTTTGKLQLLVNNHLAYEGRLPPPETKILGVAFGFDGGGAVKAISLVDGNKEVFRAY